MPQGAGSSAPTAKQVLLFPRAVCSQVICALLSGWSVGMGKFFKTGIAGKKHRQETSCNMAIKNTAVEGEQDLAPVCCCRTSIWGGEAKREQSL